MLLINRSITTSLPRQTRSTTARAVQPVPAPHDTCIGPNTPDKASFDDIWFEIFSPNMFSSFQNTNLQIIEMIIKNQPDEDDFITKWMQLTMTHGINGKSSFSKIKRCAHIDNLKAYIAFIQQCPNLDKYVIIQPSATNLNCFEFGLLINIDTSNAQNTVRTFIWSFSWILLKHNCLILNYWLLCFNDLFMNT